MVKRIGLKLKEQKGFTLIELLAVIVILGILAAIAIPAIGGIIEKSRDDAKVAEAISIIDGARISFLELDITSTAPGGGIAWVTDAAGKVTGVTWSVATGASPTNPLKEYVSKVQDPDGYTVTYTIGSNEYKITGHIAEDTKEGTVVKADGLTEGELATLAK